MAGGSQIIISSDGITIKTPGEDYVKEFTYTANGGGKCYFINYKKSWGIEPKRTISDTKRFFIGGFSDSIFDSPECQPTNR